MFVKIGVSQELYNRKTTVLVSLFNKVAGLKLCNFMTDSITGAFLSIFMWNIAKYLRTAFFKEHLWWLLLSA